MNLLQIPAKDNSAYGRCVLDMLFTRAEQAASVILPTKKSSKPPLSPTRVRKLFGKLMEQRHMHSHDNTIIICY